MKSKNNKKICSRCQNEKSLNDFSKNKFNKDGLQNLCKICVRENYLENKDKILLKTKQYYINNKEKINLKGKQYYIEHKETMNTNNRQWRSKHKDDSKIYNKQYRLENKEAISLQRKKHRLEHKDKIKLQKHQYYLRHKKEILLKSKQHKLKHKEETRQYNHRYNSNPMNKEKNNNRIKVRCETDGSFRLLRCLRGRMNKALKTQGVKKSLHVVECLSCTAEFFQNYIKSLFKPGMTLTNNGKRKWHLHHIKHCYTFDFSDPRQQKLCFHYTNTIPVWEDEHRALHANDCIE